ncbi:hypothetical protein LEN26_020793 [Aphanomyces euteiches]|nr:hypothetical protein LEN26_020793 [Aphanomyces euteiches]
MHRHLLYPDAGERSPTRACVTEDMKDKIKNWLLDRPCCKPKDIYHKLEAAHTRREFGRCPMPSLKQVQEAVKYMRVKDMRHQSTVQATELELFRRMQPDDIADEDDPFVFGVPIIDGQPRVGDGGIEAFRAGFTSITLLRKYVAIYEENPGFRVMIHADTTFKTNKSGYPIFVLGYFDRSSRFHTLCVSIISQRRSQDFHWVLSSLWSLMLEKLNYIWKPRLFMGDAGKAQYRGLMEVIAPNTPEVQYLICFFHVIKKCYEKKSGLIWSEWCTISFDIYLLHLSSSFQYLLDKMARVYENWSTSRELKKFRSYIFDTWLPRQVPFSRRNEFRFWKWQVYHSDSGSALTNNPNGHFNAELKRFVNNQNLHVPHLVQEICRLLSNESRSRTVWATEAMVSGRLKRHYQKLQKLRLLQVSDVVSENPMTWRVRHLAAYEAQQDDQERLNFSTGSYHEMSSRNPISRNLRRLELYMQPPMGWDVVHADGVVRCSCLVWVRNCICVHSIALSCQIGKIPPGMEGAPRKLKNRTHRQRPREDAFVEIVCGTSAVGLITTDAALKIVGDLSKHDADNDGDVDINSCQAGYGTKGFGTTTSSANYQAALNHRDITFRNGDGWFGDDRKPIKWFECAL